MIVIINDTLGAYGGTHTLTLRICVWLQQNGYNSMVLCNNSNNQEIVDILKKNNTRIIQLDSSNANEVLSIVSDIKKRDDLKIISYMWDKYLDMERLKRRKGIRFDNILYCVHYGTFLIGSTYPSPIKQLVKAHYYKIFNRMNKNKSVVMMDEDTTQKTSEWFKEDCSPNTPIIRIPMICEDREDSKEIIYSGYDSNIIMSASRAEFPYKGYQIGLIEMFSILKQEYESLKLVMVSGGEAEDVDKIKIKIKKLPESVQSDVEFHDWMDYDELKKQIEKCKLFIGMGTSVLDAGLKYKPAIAVRYNTYDVIASNMLSEKPWMITSEEGCTSSAIDLMRKILDMDIEEYIGESYKTFEAVKDCYDVESNLRKLLDISPLKNTSILNLWDVMIIKVHRFVSHLRHHRDRTFEVVNIRRE